MPDLEMTRDGLAEDTGDFFDVERGAMERRRIVNPKAEQESSGSIVDGSFSTLRFLDRSRLTKDRSSSHHTLLLRLSLQENAFLITSNPMWTLEYKKCSRPLSKRRIIMCTLVRI
jgi:hypothetical protein